MWSVLFQLGRAACMSGHPLSSARLPRFRPAIWQRYAMWAAHCNPHRQCPYLLPAQQWKCFMMAFACAMKKEKTLCFQEAPEHNLRLSQDQLLTQSAELPSPSLWEGTALSELTEAVGISQHWRMRLWEGEVSRNLRRVLPKHGTCLSRCCGLR